MSLPDFDAWETDDFDGYEEEEDDAEIDPRLVCACGNDKLSSEDVCGDCAEDEDE